MTLIFETVRLINFILHAQLLVEVIYFYLNVSVPGMFAPWELVLSTLSD